MFGQPRLSRIRQEYPAPLEMFQRTKVHADNVALDKNTHDPRFLPRATLARFTRNFAAAEFALARAGMLDYPDLLYRLRDQFRQSKVDLMEADETHQQERRDAVISALEAYKKVAAALDAPVRVRLTFWERLRATPARAARLVSGLTLRQMLRIYTGLKARLDEHQSAVEFEEVRAKLRADMVREARLFEEILIRSWTQMGHCYSYTVTRRGKSVTRTDKVRFQEIHSTVEAHHFKILTTTIGWFGVPHHHLPERVSITKLLERDMLANLTTACERPVTTPHNDLERTEFDNGAWLTVHRLSKADGMLSHVPLSECWHEFPHDMRHLMPLPVGVKKGNIVHYMPLVKKPHFLVAGQTGSGKTNLYNVILATLAKFFTPQEIQIVLCDFKEGLGFQKWEKLPHLVAPVITELGELLKMLKRLERLRHDRTIMMRGLADDIEEYNRRVSPERRMPHILVIMDEFQQASTNREFREPIMNYVAQLTSKARSAGIHLVPGTQTPMADQVPNPVKNNMAVVISGRMRTLAASVAAFGSKDATELANIPGRMYLEDGVNNYQIQVPYCSDTNIKDAQLSAASWPPYVLALPEIDGEEALPAFDEAAILSYIVNHAGGRLSTRAVYPYAAEFGISRAKLTGMIDALVARVKAEGGTIDIGGRAYSAKRHARGWMLQSTDDESVSFPEEAAAD